MKKMNLSLLVAVATLMLGACQSPIKVEEIVNDVIEQDSPVEVEKSTSRLVKTTYYDKSLFKLPLDHPYWSTTVLSSDTIEKLKEHYGFIDEEMVADNEVMTEEDYKDISSEKVNGNLSSEEVSMNETTESSSIVSTSKPNTNNNVSTSTKPNTNTANSATNNSNGATKPNHNQNNQSSSNSSTNKPTAPPVVEEKPQPTPPVVEQPSTPAPQPTPPVVEETKKTVDLLDWSHIKSTLIAKGESLGMTLDTSLNKNNHGYASPWQSSYMPVTNEDVIGYIGYQMEEASSWGVTDFNIEWIPQGDGNVNIYLIR